MKQFEKKTDFVGIILILILVVVLFCYMQLKVFHKPYINCFGYTVFQVVTGSMSGTIEIEDVVIVKLTDNIEKNDIITFKSGENFVTHRLLEKYDDMLITKGDANNTEDDPIPIQDVIGKVVIIIPNVAIIIKVIKTPQIIGILSLLILVIYFMFFKKK